MDFLLPATVAFVLQTKVATMRDFMSSNPLPARPRRTTRTRQMRERRTAQALMIFGVVLAAVELYVILGTF